MLPPLVAGNDKACFAVTEPDAGLDTLALSTRAVRDGDRYIVTGCKIWISTAQVATKMLLLARTDAARSSEEAHRGAVAVLHRPRPPPRRGPRDREDGPQGGRIRTCCSLTPCRCPPPIASARRAGVRIHSSRHESRAHPDRGGSGGPRSRRARQGRRLCQRAGRVRAADRPEPGHPASARGRAG